MLLLRHPLHRLQIYVAFLASCGMDFWCILGYRIEKVDIRFLLLLLHLLYYQLQSIVKQFWRMQWTNHDSHYNTIYTWTKLFCWKILIFIFCVWNNTLLTHCCKLVRKMLWIQHFESQSWTCLTSAWMKLKALYTYLLNVNGNYDSSPGGSCCFFGEVGESGVGGTLATEGLPGLLLGVVSSTGCLAVSTSFSFSFSFSLSFSVCDFLFSAAIGQPKRLKGKQISIN